MKKWFFLLSCIVISTMGLLQASFNPNVSRVYADQFTPEIYQTQLAGIVGTLDGTFGSGGNLNINGISSNQGVGIQALSNGNFLVVVSGTPSQVAMYNSEGTLQTYGTSGIATLGTPSAVPLATILDAQGRLLVAGGSGTGWINRVSTDGTTVTPFSGGTWSFIGGLAQQSTGEIIAVGFNGTNAQIGLYTFAGALDGSFGTSGVVTLSGGTDSLSHQLPTVGTGLYSVVVDANNNIYVAFVASATNSPFTINHAYIARFTSVGNLDISWNSTGFVALTALNSATSGLYVAQNHDTNFIIGAQVSTNVIVTGVTSAGGTIGGFTTFNTSSIATVGGNSFTITDLITTSDDSIFIIGSDTTSTPRMVVIRLVGSTGALDLTFNGIGYNLFNISGGTITTSTMTAASVALDGQLYTIGYQTISSGPITTPYVSRFYNTPYITQVAQFPLAQEQGILDLSFGNTGTELYAGVTNPINGLYGSLLRQRATAAIEMTVSGGAITQGDIIVGINGMTNASSNSNMMFAFLNQEGAVDTALGSNGYLTLANASSSNEYITAMLEDGLGNIYISGYTSTSSTPTSPGNSVNTAAILRAYPTHASLVSTAAWAVSQPTVSTTYAQGVGLSLQNNRVLLCVDEGTGAGHITSYIAGIVDTTFGDSGSGTISSTSFSLNMGPCYGLAINSAGSIFAAYVDNSTPTSQGVCAVKFLSDGSGLDAVFSFTTGIVSNIFSGYTVVPNNVRIGFTTGGNLVVGAVTSTGILVAFIDATTGVVTTSTSTPLAITGTTSLTLTRLTGVSDGTVLLTFWDSATNDTMYIARVTSGAILDTTFNSQGSAQTMYQQGVLAIQIGINYPTQTATSALVQSTTGVNKGNIVVVGYESVTASDATPMAMRVCGDLTSTEILDYSLSSYTPGTFGTAYNLDSAPVISAGSGNVIFTYPSTNVNAGKLLIGIDTGSTSIVARVYESNMALDTGTFGSGSGYYTVTGSLTGISTISVDANNNILIGGTSGSGWAQVINNAGTSSIPCNMPGGITQVNQILQQQSGRYIVAGATSSHGIVVAFQDVSSSGAFQVDSSFNPLSVNPLATGLAPLAGSFYVDTAGLYAMVINPNDTIVVAYSISGTVNIAEITADGSGLVFGPTVTGVATDSSATIRLNIDGSQNIVVAGSVAASFQLQVERFNSAGTTSTGAFPNGGIVSGHVATITFAGSSSVTLTGLMATTTQQTVLTGYNTPAGIPPANGQLFAVRLTSTGALDSNWNSTPTSPDVAGIVTYGADSAVAINGSSIAIDGTILSIASSASDPIVTAIYGDALVTQVAQNPLQSPCGTLDSTIPGGSTGSLALSGLITGVPQKIYIYNATVNSSPNGAMLIASTDSTHVYLKQLNQDLSVNTNFATATSNVVTFTVSGVTITDLYVANGTNDTTQPIYLVGYSSGNAPWAARVPYNGATPTIISPASALTSTGCIRQSSNGRVLISGYNGTSGAIVAYNVAMTAIDTSFGNGTGYYTTGVATPIVAMTTDNYDRIYIAYANAGGTNIIVQRLLENGTAVDSSFTATFTSGTYPTGVTNQIKMAIDLTNNMLVVAAQNGVSINNVLQVVRFNYSGGTVAAGAISTITIPGKTLNISDLFIDSDLFIYVVGNNTTDSKTIVARIAPTNSTTITLDATYAAAVIPAPAGIANIAIGAMTLTTAGMLDTDGRVYLVGSNGSTLGYMGRLFNNQYWTEISPAILQGVVGTLDLTLAPGNTGGIDLSSLLVPITWGITLSGHSKAQAIIENQNGDGSSFIAFVANGNLFVGKLNADIVPVIAFGGSNSALTSASIAMSAVNSITQDASGNIIVAGTNSSLQVVVLFNASGILQATFTNSLSATVGTTVVQQKSGRYLVGGYDGSANGLVSAYKNASAIVSPGSSGTLALDQTFGPAGSNGYYPTGVTSQIDDLCIDSNDYIYIVYRNSGTINVAKLTPEGSLSTSINTPSAQQWSTNPITSTGITSATQPARIAINGAGNILIGASTSNNSNDVEVALYNGSTGAVIQAAYSIYSTNSPVLTKLVGSIASTNEFYGAMYTTAPAAVVFAITSAGALDTTGFNASNGYLSTTVTSVTQVNGLAVQPDGKVVMVGYNGTGSPDAILIRVYGYPYISQFAQAPDQVAAGQLDTTLWPTTGAFLLNATSNSSFNSALSGGSGYAVKRVYESGNGLMTFVADSGNNSVIFQLLKDLTVNTAFNTNGFVSLATNYGGTTGLFVNSLGQNFIVGNKSSTAWLQGVSATGGSLSPALAVTAFMGSVQAVSQQNTGRIIVAGLGTTTGSKQPNANGYLVGLTTSGTPDTTFGVSGNVDMGSAHAITDIAIDPYNNIMTVALNSNTVILQKVTPAGVRTDISGAGTAIATATTGSSIKVVVDATDNIVVAAATSSGYIVRSYINNVTGSGSASGTNNATAAVTITAGTTPVLSNIYATSDGKITLIGYDSSTGNAIVIRLLSSGTGVSGAGTLTVDTTFNAALTGAGTPQVGVLIASLGGSGYMNQFFDGIIHADDRIMLVGSNSSSAAPYMGRIFGDLYATLVPQAPTLGVPGTLDTTFGSTTPPTGYYNLSTLGSGILNNSKGEAILSISTGGYYIVVDNGTNSFLMRNLVNGSLDTTYNAGATNYVAGIAHSNAPTGINSMMMDGSGRIVLVGTKSSGGWVQRYQSGSSGFIDTTFGSSGVINLASGTTATVAVEQTLGRLVVAGYNGTSGALYAYTSLDPYTVTTGASDTTFNATITPGIFTTGVAHGIYTLIADQYDRLIFAALNNVGTGISLYRLTPTGELDITFGSSGMISNVFGSSTFDDTTQVRVALNSAGNIVVAAHMTTGGGKIAVVAYDNGVLTTTGANGNIVNAEFDISSLTSPTITALVNSADGDTLVLGNQSGTNGTWVARLLLAGSSTVALDTANFNPAGSPAGIFQYAAGGGATAHIYNAMVVNYQGEVEVLGYEQTGGSYTPSLLQVFNDPGTTQQSQSPNSKQVGTNDVTLGVSPTAVTAKGITFFGSSAGTAASGQVARAIALQDDNNIVIAVDGNAAAGSGNSDIMISMFDNDGLLNRSFNSSGTPGMATVLTYYPNQYVKDMMTYTTASNVNKAVLVGYATSGSPLNVTGSLVLQYNLSIVSPATTPGLDPNFGGLNTNPPGVAFASGGGYQAWVVGQQSFGRIIVGGLTQSGIGLLLAYTPTGNLDQSFNGTGYQATAGSAANYPQSGTPITGITGIYSLAIDSLNRIVIAYNSGSTVNVARFLSDGSKLDTTFNGGNGYISTISGLQTGVNNNFKVAVDSSNNVIVAAVTNSGNHIAVNNYPVTGGTATYTSSITGTQLGNASAVYTLGRLLVDAQGNVIVIAYDTNATKTLVMRLVGSGSNYILDTTFNTNGYITYQVAGGSTSQVVTNALIHPDGRIMVVGSEV